MKNWFKGPKSRETFLDIVSALLILLFLYTGLSKLLHSLTFLGQLKQSPWPLISNNAEFISWSLPWLEIVTVALLVIPFKGIRTAGFYLSAILMIAFTTYVFVLLVSGRHLPCSCGGVIAYLSWKQHLLFNLVFLILSIWAIIKIRKEKVVEDRVDKTYNVSGI